MALLYISSITSESDDFFHIYTFLCLSPLMSIAFRIPYLLSVKLLFFFFLLICRRPLYSRYPL